MRAPITTMALCLLLLLLLARGALATVTAAPSACAVAWNRDSSATLRSIVVTDKARGAFISSSVVTGLDWTKNGRTRSTTGAGCSIQFILPSGRTLAVWGSWTRGSISRWLGPVLSTRAIPVPDNTSVHADGSVGFHG